VYKEMFEGERLRKVGIELNSKKRSGSFLLLDQEVKKVLKFREGLEILPIRDALNKYDWLNDYLWRALKKDEYSKEVEEEFNGYFIRALPNSKIIMPVEACFYLSNVKKQKIHNIIIAEEGSEINIISGCTSHPTATGMHIGVSEFFVKKNAKLTFTMIHNWTENIEVRPRTGIIVEDGGVFISNYVLLSPVKLIQTYPTAYLHENAKAVFSSIVVAFKNSTIDLGNKVVLSGRGSSAEIISRAISKGGVVIARGQIVAEVPDVKGHLECRGLILNDGIIRAIPELEARCSNVELSHEAAIGKIAEEEIFYLMARGMSRDEAMSTIIRGFMEIEMKDLPPELKTEINKAIELVGKYLL